MVRDVVRIGLLDRTAHTDRPPRGSCREETTKRRTAPLGQVQGDSVSASVESANGTAVAGKAWFESPPLAVPRWRIVFDVVARPVSDGDTNRQSGLE